MHDFDAEPLRHRARLEGFGLRMGIPVVIGWMSPTKRRTSLRDEAQQSIINATCMRVRRGRQHLAWFQDLRGFSFGAANIFNALNPPINIFCHFLAPSTHSASVVGRNMMKLCRAQSSTSRGPQKQGYDGEKHSH